MEIIWLSRLSCAFCMQIREYIHHDLKNPVAARKFVQNMKNDLRILEGHAEAGPSLEALTRSPTSLRTLVCGKYISIYDTKGHTVRIARILDERQDYLRLGKGIVQIYIFV